MKKLFVLIASLLIIFNAKIISAESPSEYIDYNTLDRIGDFSTGQESTDYRSSEAAEADATMTNLNSENKVTIIFEKNLLRRLGYAIVDYISGYEVHFAGNEKEIPEILAKEGRLSRVTDLRLRDHGIPDVVDNIEPNNIPEGTSKFMAPGATLDVCVCNFGHSDEYWRKFLGKSLLGENGGSMISYKGYYVFWGMIFPTKNRSFNSLFKPVVVRKEERIEFPSPPCQLPCYSFKVTLDTIYVDRLGLLPHFGSKGYEVVDTIQSSEEEAVQEYCDNIFSSDNSQN